MIKTLACSVQCRWYGKGSSLTEIPSIVFPVYLCCLQSVLSEAASRRDHEIHITPKYLVPDTNCYVDRLPSIKALVDTAHFTVAVPLIGTFLILGVIRGMRISISMFPVLDCAYIFTQCMLVEPV